MTGEDFSLMIMAAAMPIALLVAIAIVGLVIWRDTRRERTSSDEAQPGGFGSH
ncbi:hypothetical protein [Algiphilus aromaticivorans]|jgi:hypothetical protein|uniref:hypothetical protein n=1 Tax=Algiphilus aromaticivorans TaxID=382454 RepID=UPI0012EBF83D|nr:hypothetical protein [Algiphilus aromaticivorans]